MTLLRAAARTLLASFFVVNGADAIRKPQAHVAEVEPVVSQVLPIAQRVIPPTAAVYLPEEPRTWARICGAAQFAGGIMLATGLGRRLGAAVLVGTMAVKVATTAPLPGRSESEGFSRNVALLGGVLLAAQDTEGKPGLAWRIEDKRKDASAVVDKASKKFSVAADRAGKKAVKAGRKARKEARRATKRVQETLS